MMNWLRRIFRFWAKPRIPSSVPVLYVQMPKGSTLSPSYVSDVGKILPGVRVRVVYDPHRNHWDGVAFSVQGFDLPPETYCELTAALAWSFPDPLLVPASTARKEGVN